MRVRGCGGGKNEKVYLFLENMTGAGRVNDIWGGGGNVN